MTIFVIYNTVHLWQDYSVDECDTMQEAIQKQKEHPDWLSWIAVEIETNEIEIPADRLEILE